MQNLGGKQSVLWAIGKQRIQGHWSPRNNRKYQLFARFYNEKTLTVPLRNVSKLVRTEDHLLNKPPNSMCSESRFQ